MSQDFLKQLETILNSALQIFQLVATFVVAFLVVLWMTLCVWTFRDIQARTRDVVAQVFATLLVVFFNIPGVLLYILVRPKETLVQAYERSLQEEYMLQDLEEREICPTCRVKTQPDFMFCFNCRTRLRRECSSCGHLIKLKWVGCPFCGTPQKAKPREAMPERTGLGAPRPGGTSPRPPQPQPAPGTALATSASAAGQPTAPLPVNYYQQNSSSPSSPSYDPAPATMPLPNQPGQSPYADGGQDYNQNEPSYRYQPDHDFRPPANGGRTTAELSDELAPELNPEIEADYQSDHQYQPPGQRRNKNGRTSKE